MVWMRDFWPLRLLPKPLSHNGRQRGRQYESILLVGSDQAMHLLQDMRQAKVDLALNPRQAVRMAWNGDYDVVVLALGFSQCLITVRTLQRIPDYEFTPIIVIAEQCAPSEQTTLRNSGIQHIIPAPATPQALHAALLQVAASACALPQQSRVVL